MSDVSQCLWTRSLILLMTDLKITDRRWPVFSEWRSNSLRPFAREESSLWSGSWLERSRRKGPSAFKGSTTIKYLMLWLASKPMSYRFSSRQKRDTPAEAKEKELTPMPKSWRYNWTGFASWGRVAWILKYYSYNLGLENTWTQRIALPRRKK